MKIYKILFLVVFLIVSQNSYAESPLLKLIVKADKEIYSEDQDIKVQYSIKNITNANVIYYAKDENPDASPTFEFINTKRVSVGERSGCSYSESQFVGPPAHYELAPQEKSPVKEITIGKMIFGESKGCYKAKKYHPDPKYKPKRFCLAEAIFYDGFLMKDSSSSIHEDTLKIEVGFCTQEDSGKFWGGGDPDAYIGCLEPVTLDIVLDLNVPQEGVVKSYHEDGTLRLERNYKGGKLNGQAKYYYKEEYDGSSYGIRNYKDGKLEGEAVDYYDNDQPRVVWHFTGGVLTGETRSYFKNGQLKSKAYFKDGKLDGPVDVYTENGELKYSAIYKDDELQDQILNVKVTE